jgi:hypothetical protein
MHVMCHMRRIRACARQTVEELLGLAISKGLSQSPILAPKIPHRHAHQIGRQSTSQGSKVAKPPIHKIPAKAIVSPDLRIALIWLKRALRRGGIWPGCGVGVEDEVRVWDVLDPRRLASLVAHSDFILEPTSGFF